MNKKQQVILSLLKEIDEICRKHQIEYFLSPRLTLCAVQEQPFPQNPLFGVVLMKVPEMERFRQVWRKIQEKKEHWIHEKSQMVSGILFKIRKYRYCLHESGHSQRVRISGTADKY